MDSTLILERIITKENMAFFKRAAFDIDLENEFEKNFLREYLPFYEEKYVKDIQNALSTVIIEIKNNVVAYAFNDLLPDCDLCCVMRIYGGRDILNFFCRDFGPGMSRKKWNESIDGRGGVSFLNTKSKIFHQSDLFEDNIRGALIWAQRNMQIIN